MYNMDQLNSYVRGGDAARFTKLPQGVVSLNITHSNLKQRWPEIKFDLRMTIASVKDKLYFHGGTNASFMRLVLQDAGGEHDWHNG